MSTEPMPARDPGTPGVSAAPQSRDRARMLQRLGRFLDQLEGDIYPEPVAEMSKQFVSMGLDLMDEELSLNAEMRILDVGSGNGVALRAFRERGLRAEGVGLGSDVEHCRAEGFEVHEADMSDLPFEDESFDLLYARHVLEHSVLPLYTLHEWKRVLRPGGHLLVELPCPDTACRHEHNPNHYSVLGDRMWESLLAKSGLQSLQAKALSFETAAGPDRYLMILAAKL